MSRPDSARTHVRANEGSTLVLLHPGEVTDAELAGHLVALLFVAAGPIAPPDAARLLDISVEHLCDVCDLLLREPPTGLALQRWADRLQLTTAPSSAAVIELHHAGQLLPAASPAGQAFSAQANDRLHAQGSDAIQRTDQRLAYSASIVLIRSVVEVKHIRPMRLHGFRT